MLGQLPRQDEPRRSLDLARRDGVLLVVPSQSRGFAGQPFKHVVDKRVHDLHRLVGDARLWMDVLQQLEDEGRVGGVVALLPTRLL